MLVLIRKLVSAESALGTSYGQTSFTEVAEQRFHYVVTPGMRIIRAGVSAKGALHAAVFERDGEPSRL